MGRDRESKVKENAQNTGRKGGEKGKVRDKDRREVEGNRVGERRGKAKGTGRQRGSGERERKRQSSPEATISKQGKKCAFPVFHIFPVLLILLQEVMI